MVCLVVANLHENRFEPQELLVEDYDFLLKLQLVIFDFGHAVSPSTSSTRLVGIAVTGMSVHNGIPLLSKGCCVDIVTLFDYMSVFLNIGAVLLPFIALLLMTWRVLKEKIIC